MTSKIFISLFILLITSAYSIEIKWQQCTNNNNTSRINDICWSGSNFISVGDSGHISLSPKGCEWEKVTIKSTQDLYAICVSPTAIVAVGGTNKLNQSNGQSDKDIFRSLILRSVDNGITWDSIPIPTDAMLRDVGWNGSSFVATGFSVIGPYTYINSAILRSQDGISWELIEAPSLWQGPHTLHYLKNNYFIGTYSSILSSTDGTNWSKVYDASISQADYSKLFTIGDDIYFDTHTSLVHSSDGSSWMTKKSEETVVGCYKASTITENMEFIATDSGNYINHEDIIQKIESDTSKIKLLTSSDSILVSVTALNTIQYAEIPTVSSIITQTNLQTTSQPFLIQNSKIILPKTMTFRFKLFSILGQELLSQSENSHEIVLKKTDLSQGMYLFQLITDTYSTNGQIMLQ